MCEPDAAAGAFADGVGGASSVLYGTVPDLAPKGDIGRGFALFYSGVTGAGGLAPIAYAVIADHSNRTVGILAAALTAAVIIPLVLALRSHEKAERGVLAHQES
jgi:MFS transporter, FSR family, fosmidomycin resistance protein